MLICWCFSLYYDLQISRSGSNDKMEAYLGKMQKVVTGNCFQPFSITLATGKFSLYITIIFSPNELF